MRGAAVDLRTGRSRSGELGSPWWCLVWPGCAARGRYCRNEERGPGLLPGVVWRAGKVCSMACDARVLAAG